MLPRNSKNVEILSFRCLVRPDRPEINYYVSVWSLGCPLNPINPLKPQKTTKNHSEQKTVFVRGILGKRGFKLDYFQNLNEAPKAP